MGRLCRLSCLLVCATLTLAGDGYAFGPKALQRSHGLYNESVKQVAEEQLLLNIVRLRYNDNPARLDIAAIAAQYEIGGSLEARPFFSTDATGSLIQPFTRVLPFANVQGSNRPTITLNPVDDADSIRSHFKVSTLEGIIFLAETSWPASTVFRLWGENLNNLPNAPTTSGPPRPIVPEYLDYLTAMKLLQTLQDRGDIRFVQEEERTAIAAQAGRRRGNDTGSSQVLVVSSPFR